eukprot:COSAG06_NODE_827_length_12062_cov_46.356182_7_plen_440_part_00
MSKLHDAARAGDTAAIDRLVREGAEVNAVDGYLYGNTPLHYAAREGHAEAVEALARAGAELNAVNRAGDTPLHRAAREGHAEAVEALARAGAEVKAVSSDGLTPLHWAAREGGAEAVEALARAGAELSAVNKKGNTPLHLAAEYGHAEAAEALAWAGAELSAVNKEGKTPLQVVQANGHTQVVSALRRHQQDLRAAALAALADDAPLLHWPPGSSQELGRLQRLALGGLRLGDAAAGSLLRRLRAGGAMPLLLAVDLCGNELAEVPAGLESLRQLEAVDLRDNDLAELPLALLEGLPRLRRLRLEGNRRLEREAAILEERGLPGLRGYLRGLHDDPKPTFKLKLLLAGPSMAGKSSLARALKGEERRLTDEFTERTIGLEIVRFVLPDPRGRAPVGVDFIACELPLCCCPSLPVRASGSTCCCARTCGSVGAPAGWLTG